MGTYNSKELVVEIIKSAMLSLVSLASQQEFEPSRRGHGCTFLALETEYARQSDLIIDKLNSKIFAEKRKCTHQL